MKQILLLFVMLTCTIGKAESFEDIRGLHDMVHAGGGFAVNGLSYGLWKQIVLPEDLWVAHVLAILTTSIVAASKEASDLSKPGGKFSGRDFGYSMLGAGAFTGCALMFNF